MVNIDIVGTSVGGILLFTVGALENTLQLIPGIMVGGPAIAADGSNVGLDDGRTVGTLVGVGVGLTVGTLLGAGVGLTDGDLLGAGVGILVGRFVGNGVGLLVGPIVKTNVGIIVVGNLVFLTLVGRFVLTIFFTDGLGVETDKGEPVGLLVRLTLRLDGLGVGVPSSVTTKV
jgi:hypothetical protein